MFWQQAGTIENPRPAKFKNIMETTTASRHIQIENLYRAHSQRIFAFIASRIDSRADAENLSQDVWMRILDNGCEIIEETALSFLYRIAVNLINDYLRQRYARPVFEAAPDQWNDIAMAETPLETLEAAQLAEIELSRVENMPPQRRIIYMMSRFDDQPVQEIASKLSLSLRTVENHLRLGRHDVRDYMRALA